MRSVMHVVTTAAAAAVFGTVGTVWAVPEVTNVQMVQRANSRWVDITYSLSGESAIVTLGIETNGVALPDSVVTRLSGDVCKVVPTGIDKHIVWNAGADWPENVVSNAKARVTAWITNAPPQVMVVDLSKGTAATAQDPYPVYYYVSVDALPYGGLTNEVYKTEYLVLRKLPAGLFSMGEGGGSVAVTLSHDFYAGVFEVTQMQWVKVTGSNPSSFGKLSEPVENLSYDLIRGSAEQGGGGWPANDAVYESSFMGLLRAKTGIATFDLPTEAQWEYLCRAGTTSYYNDGLPGASDEQLSELGWWVSNSEGTTHTVGLKTPNAWSLFDAHGNVWELCLDWYGAVLSGGNDPAGANSGVFRIAKGGGWGSPAPHCRPAFRNYDGLSPSYFDSSIGCRLVVNLP